MGKLSLKKSSTPKTKGQEKDEKQTTISSFFKVPSKSNSATTSSLFSTIGSSTSSSSVSSLSSSSTLKQASHSKAKAKPSTFLQSENKSGAWDGDGVNSNRKHDPREKGLNKLSDRVGSVAHRSVVTARADSHVTENKPASSASNNNTSGKFAPCDDDKANNNVVPADAGPGSFFFSAASSDANTTVSDRASEEEIMVIPETQVDSFVSIKKDSVPHEKKGICDSSRSKKVCDLNDSLTIIPSTPESKPPSGARKKFLGRSFMLSASNLSSGGEQFKPRKQLKQIKKGKSSEPEPTPFEGCNYSLTESNKEIEKYSELQMQVLYSAHGLVPSPVSLPVSEQKSDTSAIESSEKSPSSLLGANYKRQNSNSSSDTKQKKPHVVSSKFQKHCGPSGKMESVPISTSSMDNVSKNGSKGGLKRSCAKGTGVSPNPKRLPSKQHYGHVALTKRDLNSELGMGNTSESMQGSSDCVEPSSPRVDEHYCSDKSENPHKSTVNKKRFLQKQSPSCAGVISARKRKGIAPTTSSNIPPKSHGNLADDELLANLIGEMTSPVTLTVKTKLNTDDSRPNINLSGVSVGDAGQDCVAEAISPSPGDDEDILSDIIGEIRCSTQATQSHSYDKKLSRKWNKTDAKNRATCDSATTSFNDLDQSGTSGGKLDTDLLSNSIVPESASSHTSDQKTGPEGLALDCDSSLLKESAGVKEIEELFMDCDPIEETRPKDVCNDFVIKDNLSHRANASFDSVDPALNSEASTEKSSEMSEEIQTADNIPYMEYADFSMDGSWMENINLDKPDEDLSKSFSKFSPFKQTLENFHPKNCPPHCTKFGRHLVTDVQAVGHDVHLLLNSIPDDKKRKCILKGFWADTHVKSGDIVNVLSHFDASGVSYVSDQQGLLVVNPDYLLSGTTVVSSVFCMRKSVLNAKFKGMDGRNVHMLYGSMIHSLFQKVIQERQFNEDAMLATARDIMLEKKFLHEMYALGLKEEKVLDEMKIYIPQIISWAEKHCHQGLFTFGEKRQPKGELSVIGVKDIEENVWSPRFGIKGKIDVTVDVKFHKNTGAARKIVPLELKTGKSSFSMEHKGQVTLYSMMTSDRRPDPEMGILLYLKDGQMQSVPAKEQNKKGLLQLRNELTHYLTNTLKKVDGDDKKLTSLPRPISNDRACKKCAHLLTCSLYQRSIEQLSLPGHPMETLVPETLSHLSQSHLDFFVSWCTMLQMEAQASKSQDHTKNIWCKSSLERESKGSCLSSMILSKDSTTDKMLEGGSTVHTFVRYHAHPSEKLGGSYTQGESIVISIENKGVIALSIGYVMNFTEDFIEISTDRNLRNYPDYNTMIFCLDKCNLYDSMGTNFSNLAKLMEDDPVSARLRELLIDQRVPEFIHTLSKGAVEKVRHVFKKLNKPQKTAVLKVLMSQDYVLIKGYPGTGKTSTIVALVRILVCLGYSILLTSYTHSAVDNILLKLIENDVDFLRIGRIEKIHPAVQPYLAEVLTKDIKSVQELETFYASKQIVATTCFGVTHQLFTQRFFDICIIDEASQILQPTCMGPLFYAKKFALVGDPKQLPPVVQSESAIAQGMDKSLIVQLDTNGATYELDVQYRMNRNIMELSNQLIYGGILKCGSEDVASSCLQIPNTDFIRELPKTCEWIKSSLDNTPGQEVVFLDTTQVPAPESRSNEGQLKNENEAMMALQISYALLKSGIKPADIGIIAPYRNQVLFIKKMLESLSCLFGQIEVNTVDQYQGRDKDVIIISYVRSQASHENKRDILHDIRRLNVAITRAKHKLIFIGHIPTLRSYGPLKGLLDLLREDQIYPLPAAAHSHLVLAGEKNRC